MTDHAQSKESKIPTWGLPTLSWLVSFYFLSGFVDDLGFPPKPNVSWSHIVLLVMWLFFLFLPFFNKIKIGKFLELEREVEKTKSEMKEFKEDVRNNLSIISTNINSIGNLSNQLTLNLPGYSDLESFKKLLDEKFPEAKVKRSQEIREELLLDEDDTVMALARTRIKIESLLRKITQKPEFNFPASESRDRFIPIHEMFRMVVQRYDQYYDLRKPFDFVIRACNAAVHAQRISQTQADEAIQLGAKIIAILSELSNGAEPGPGLAT